MFIFCPSKTEDTHQCNGHDRSSLKLWYIDLPGKNGIIRCEGFLAPASSGNNANNFICLEESSCYFNDDQITTFSILMHCSHTQTMHEEIPQQI